VVVRVGLLEPLLGWLRRKFPRSLPQLLQIIFRCMRTYGLTDEGLFANHSKTSLHGDWSISFPSPTCTTEPKGRIQMLGYHTQHNKKPLQVRAFISAHLSSLGDNMKDTICNVAVQPQTGNSCADNRKTKTK
jgi:hypothetical protein